MADQALLEVSDLKTWFELRRLGFFRIGHVRAVDGVNLSLRRGEAVAIVGESGCGKSTLVRTILGLNKPTAGSISFDGHLVEGSPRDLQWYRARVGYVQQDPYGALAPFMTVDQILDEPMVVNGVRDEKERQRRKIQAMEELKLTPVEDFLNKFPHMLSGGQQQRVVIARAIILQPDLVVADEPVSMLDASVRVEILKLLQNLQQNHNLALLYITHDLSTVRYFAERIFVMYAANIVEAASVQQLLDSPSHPYTQALLEAISDPDPENASHYKKVPPGEPPSLLHPPEGCRFHPRCPQRIAGVCDTQVPPLFEKEEGHTVMCWLYDTHAL